MASGYYNSLYTNLLKGELDFESGSGQTFKIALLTSAYVFGDTQRDGDVFLADVNANEVSGTNYSAGGAAIANVDITQNDTLNKSIVDGDDVSWASSTITARGAVLYKDTGSAATSPLLKYIDFGTDQSSSNTEFKVTWSASGILDLTEV